MAEASVKVEGNPLIILGDKIAPKPHLAAFVKGLRRENALLDGEQAIKYAVCGDTSEVAVTLKQHRDDVRMVLVGPGLRGNGVTVARMLASKAHIVLVVDPQVNPLGDDPTDFVRVQNNLKELGVIITLIQNANETFFQPLIKEYVLSGLPAGVDLESMTPEQRAQMIDKRLDAVNSFPSLPDTQRKVSALDDLDPPRKWAEAIDPDLPAKTVILRMLNSARYGFRTRVETIDQAVALASAKTIREIVMACQIRQIFEKTDETTIDQFWRHSLAVGFFAKLFSLPADPSQQDSQQKTEFERYRLDDEQAQLMSEAQLWSRLSPEEADADPFTAGLLHDIGKVTLLMCLEDSLELVLALIESEVQEAQAEGKLWARWAKDVERFLMKDLDHTVIGGRLAEHWEVDASMVAVIRDHHEVQERSPDLLKLIFLADLAANCLYPYPATDTQHPFPQLIARIDEAVKKSTKKGAAAVDEAISEVIFEDLVDVLDRLEIPSHVWELLDFKSFFKLVYIVSPTIKSATIGFLQQTGS